MSDPLSLHKYAYVSANPVGFVDPSGESYIAGISVASLASTSIIGMGVGAVVGGAHRAIDQYLANASWQEILLQGAIGAIGGAVIGGISAPIWQIAITGAGAAQTAAIIAAVFERSIGISLGFSSAAQAANPQQAAFRASTAYVGGLLSLLGLASINMRTDLVTGYRAQGRPLMSVDESGNILINRPLGRNREGVAVHVGFDEDRGHMWIEQMGRLELVTFKMDSNYLQWLRRNAQPEHGVVRDRSLPWKVDNSYQDQYAIPPSQLPQFERAIIKGTGRILRGPR